MTTHEVLVRARNRISDERDWYCAGRPNRWEWLHPMATCAMLALDDVGPSCLYSGDPAYEALLGPGTTMSQVIAWNDSHTHAEVLAAFDRAIASTAPEPDTEFLNNVADPVAA